MKKEKFYAPTHASGEYHCPHCNVFSKQRWSHLTAGEDLYTTHNKYGSVVHQSSIFNLAKCKGNLSEDWTISTCDHCQDLVFWKGENIIYPENINVELPNEDLDDDIKFDYLEAANILNNSPRSAAALLRLALQKLCIQLGEKGKNINEDIGALVKKGLNSAIQKSLDSLRITGNNAIHPGEIDLKEDQERVLKLFNLINFIAEKMITEPKEIDSFYSDLPNGAKDAVEKRDIE